MWSGYIGFLIIYKWMVFDFSTNYKDIKDEYIIKTIINILNRKNNINMMFSI